MAKKRKDTGKNRADVGLVEKLSLEDELRVTGRGFEIYKSLLQAVSRRGGTREHLKRVLTDAALQDRLATVIVQSGTVQAEPETVIIPDLSASEFTAFVSYKLPSFAELNGTTFDWAHELFDDTYEWQEHESVRGKVDRTPGERSFLVKHFNREMTSDWIIEWAEANCYRAATHEEAVDFAKTHPDLQRQYWIAVLGSFAVFDGHRYVAILDGSGRRRSLDYDWFGGRWNADSRFLLVRK